MKNVLILTYYWPPAGGPGVQRWLKFVKYMEELGWKAHILTVEKGTYSAVDHALEKEVPENISVYKTKSSDPFRFYNMLKGKKDGAVPVALINIDKNRSLVDRLAMYIRSNCFIPDARRGWMPYAYRQAVKIIEEKNIDLLITTGPPHSTHLAGLKLKKKNGIPWLADLRDPWTTVFYNDMLPRTARTRRIDKKYEDAVLQYADAVTVVSPGMKEEFSARNEHVEVVMNGFDGSDMRVRGYGNTGVREDENSGVLEDGKTGIRDEVFSLTYTGNFKPNQHIPEIWDGICALLQENEGFARDFSLKFVGNVDASVPEYFKQKGFESSVELVPYVPHEEVTQFMSTSAMLLFVVPRSRNNKLIITGKLFEYLASGTPILSVGPLDGDAASILADTGRETMLDYSDKDTFKHLLLKYYTQWKNGNPGKLDISILDKYSRRSSAERMARIMNNMIS